MKFEIAGRLFILDKRTLIILIVLALTIAGLVIYFILNGNNGIIIEGPSSGRAVLSSVDSRSELSREDNNITNSVDSAGLATGQVQALKEADEEISVYITGCVKRPGVVKIKKGDLINDAITKAGGFTEKADINAINLVYKINENVMLYIKPKEPIDAEKTAISENEVNISPENKGAGEAGAGITITRDSGGVIVNEVVSSQESDKININTASVAELDTLPGIGEATANDIIKYREEYGPFKHPEDIMKITGIKQSKYGKIKDFITAD